MKHNLLGMSLEELEAFFISIKEKSLGQSKFFSGSIRKVNLTFIRWQIFLKIFNQNYLNFVWLKHWNPLWERFGWRNKKMGFECWRWWFSWNGTNARRKEGNSLCFITSRMCCWLQFLRNRKARIFKKSEHFWNYRSALGSRKLFGYPRTLTKR